MTSSAAAESSFNFIVHGEVFDVAGLDSRDAFVSLEELPFTDDIGLCRVFCDIYLHGENGDETPQLRRVGLTTKVRR
jgi:hypothetical protein